MEWIRGDRIHLTSFMFKYYKTLKQYAEYKNIGYSHYITKRNTGDSRDDLLAVPDWCKYIDKTSMLIYLLAENQKK